MKPGQLAIHGIRDELLAALREHQAVIVQGPTGCGKTTQIPQMLADSGTVVDDAIIGVTQPRRLAAVSVAHRIALERGGEIGGEVAYAIRFDDRTRPDTRIKVMTDGILLQEARGDPDLSRYDVIMVDEAHERSLNIDFTLGLLRRLIDKRGDLRVIISSATINAEIFCDFFGGAPQITATAENFPVEVRYRPIKDDSRVGRVDAVADAISRLHRGPTGDILTFLTGEAEIKATVTELTRRRLKDVELLPLYGRLTREEQERVFDKFEGKRKVVLSTNIAETSITIDGVRYVVDLGLAKVPSYDSRTGIPSLRETPISQANARQRTGRAGRTAPGVCVRMYDKRDFKNRDKFPVEDVLRMDLSDVVLRLIDLGIQDVEEFPFVTPPPRRSLKAAVRDLIEMGAIDHQRNLTEFGLRMAPFPLSPRLACMIVYAAQSYPKVLHEVLTAGALLSVRWPQIMPPGDEEAAREAHRHFAQPGGDIAAGLKMVAAFEKTKDADAFCQLHYLDPTLMSEIVMVRDQLADIAAAAGLQGDRDGSVGHVIRCVARAFPGGICRRLKGNQYETATGVRVSIHPGSCLWGDRPDFLVAADIVVTHRAWARSASVLHAKSIHEVAPELADRWGIRFKNEPKARRPRVPRTVDLFGRTYNVRMKRGRPLLELTWETLKKQSAAAPVLTADQLTYRVVVRRDDDHFLSGVFLGAALKLVPHLRIDEPELKSWPEGTLMTAERELFRIMRPLPQLLRIVRSRRRGRAAFLTLIHNGAGAYWYDAAKDIKLAVEQARLALTALLREQVISDADRAQLEAATTRVDEVQEALNYSS